MLEHLPEVKRWIILGLSFLYSHMGIRKDFVTELVDQLLMSYVSGVDTCC